ncbi:hypothetical protein [Actinocrispum sp. NPDC049592]|uniref:hypothetical protein n=1 Tax=Actinocrispum sp. NPDC049592 TaxID=3154835 RepID=UPI00342E3BFF
MGAVSEVSHGLFGQELRGSVGVEGENQPGDVVIVERLLMGVGMADLDVGAAITKFQREIMGWPKADGRVDPGGRTFAALRKHQPKPQQGKPHGEAAAGAAAPAAAASKPAAPPELGGLENWPTVLPVAKRDKKTKITLTKGEDQVNIPEIDVPELTAEQKTLVEKIKANRETLPEYAIKKTTYHGNKGMVLGDSGANEKLTPTQLQGDANDPAAKARKVAFKELGHEGTVDSINTYDDQILTWGKGFSGKSGSMNEVLMIMFEQDPEARAVLLRAGIDCGRNSWRVVNTDTGMIETDDNALRLMQFDKKLLGVFVTLGRDPEHQQHALDAQWAAMEKHAAHIPEYAYDWPESSIALAAHLAHWSPAFGWGTHPKSFEKTGGDLVEIAGVWGRLAASNPKYTTVLKNGAIVGPYDMMHEGHRLLGFADGAGGKAVKAAAEIITGTRDEIGDDPKYTNHVLFPVYDKKNQYYDIGMAGN